MKTWKKVGLGLTAVPLALFAFGTWYVAHYSMGPATPFEVNRPQATEHVLIATQGSAFKDAVVRGVVARLEDRPVSVKVIDVAALEEVREADWSAIVILHTWEMWKPPPAVKAFFDRTRERHKLVVLTTSGGGKEHIDGIDAVTAASRMESELARVSSYVDEIVGRVDKVLTSRSPQTSR